jgi:hypothetical protein
MAVMVFFFFMAVLFIVFFIAMVVRPSNEREQSGIVELVELVIQLEHNFEYASVLGSNPDKANSESTHDVCTSRILAGPSQLSGGGEWSCPLAKGMKVCRLLWGFF